MNWFNNISIRSKLIVGFGVVIALAVALAIYAFNQTGQISNTYQDLIDGSIERRDASLVAQSNIRAIRRTVTGTIMHAPNANETAINALYSEMQIFNRGVLEAMERYDYSVRNDPRFDQADRNERFSLSAGVRTSLDQYINQVFYPVRAYALVGNHEAALAIVTANQQLVTSLIEATDYMINMTSTAMASGRRAAIESSDTAQSMLLVISAVIIIVAALIALLIARLISKPVQDLVGLTSLVADGKLNINIDRSKVTKDEIGALTSDVYALIDTIRNIVDDIDKFAHEANDNGDIEYRIDAAKYKGSYGDMIKSLNGFTDGFVSDVLKILNVLQQVGSGDFTFKLDPLPGKKAVLNESVDSLKANLDSVDAGINSMIDSAANKGDMHFQIDTSKYTGGWKNIMVGLNHIAEAVDKPIVEIMNVMNNLAKGDFSENVTGNYKGDFLQMKDAVNNTIKNLSGYINDISDKLSAISEGDLTQTVTREYVGSFGAIKESLNNISATLNKTMSEISVASEQVLSGASQISTGAMDLASGAQEQASSVEELSATISMISEQTRQNANDAANASELSNKSTENAQTGNEAMKQMLVAMTQIKESSNDISKIIKVIQDIAFQTNLLALNAAVEAARAGEHGKGFSVVAEEVRSLAARSQASATETTTLIGDSITRVESGSSIAETTSESLDIIVKNAAEVLNIINNIATASHEQAEAVSQVNEGLEQISKVVQNNSAVSEETATASEELNAQAEVLRQLVAFFKI